MTARDALIEATRTLLSTQGYEATSPGEIQRTSGVGQGSFYHHFNSKADLAAAALASLADDMCAEFDLFASGAQTDVIAAYLGLPRDALAGCRIGRICMESSLADARIQEPIGRYFLHLRNRLAVAFEALDTSIDAGALADLAIASVQGAYVAARATRDPSTMTRATTALLALLNNSIERGNDEP